MEQRHRCLDEILTSAGAAKHYPPLLVCGVVRSLRRFTDRLEDLAVADARAEGATWEEVARQLGVSRQLVHRKHADRLARRKE